MKFIWRVINQEGEDHILTYLCLIFLYGGGHWRNASEIIQASLESKWPDRAVWPGILRRRESRRCGGSPIEENDLDGWQHHCWWSLIMWHPDKESDVVGCHCCCRLLNGASKQTTANIVCRCSSYQSVPSVFVCLQDAPLKTVGCESGVMDFYWKMRLYIIRVPMLWRQITTLQLLLQPSKLCDALGLYIHSCTGFALASALARQIWAFHW